MAEYLLRFTVPQQRQGEPAQYKAFATTLRKLNQLVGKTQSECSVSGVEVSGGSIRGRAAITAPSYEEAFSFACRNAPIIDLEWHLEEKLNPKQVERILEEAMK